MKHFLVLSALLQHPEQALIDALPELDDVLRAHSPELQETIAPLLKHLNETDLITLQEQYVMTFDRSRSHSLHLFEHVYGESRDRGPAMVSLMEEYTARGYFIAADEIPDYLPMFLEFLSLLSPEEANDFLGEAIHVPAKIGAKLAESNNPYAYVFEALLTLTDVAPLPLAEPPVSDMDELLETFGPGADGTEPLLKPKHGNAQPINFYAPGTTPAMCNQ